MSAIDRGSGDPFEGPENTGVPRADGGERAADPARSEGSGPTPPTRSSPPETPDVEPTAASERVESETGPPVERSDAPRHPMRGHGPFPSNEPTAQPGPLGRPGPTDAHQPRDAPRSQPDSSRSGSFSAYGGGFGAPPVPPHDTFPLGSDGPRPTEPGGRDQRGGRNRTILVAAATALVTSLIVGPTAAVATNQLMSAGGLGAGSSDGGSGSASSGSVSTVADVTLPSVVSIGVDGGGGSGFIIDSSGLIVTNNHVVSGADDLVVQFDNGTQADATVVGTDPVSDLAVIRAEDVSGLTPVSLGDSDQVRVGSEVVAIGAPLGLSGTVTAGVVSALERPVNTGLTEPRPDPPQEDSPFGLPDQEEPDEQDQAVPQAGTSTVIDAIQTDAPINPGNSGGPLMNMDGEVIGINTAIATTSGGLGVGGQPGSIGLGFAIPANQAKPVIEELIADGEASYAAIEATITMPTGGRQGAELVDVVEGGAADESGLRAGDVITKVGDRRISDPNVLIAEVRSHRPGDTVTVTYQRGANTAEAQVTLSAQSTSDMGN